MIRAKSLIDLERRRYCFFAIGPVTQGTFWEVTAIPDIRVKAVEVAKAVLLALKDKKRLDLRLPLQEKDQSVAQMRKG
jgi:uncharacterized NAD(P)/FAD-binding protein YdhS